VAQHRVLDISLLIKSIPARLLELEVHNGEVIAVQDAGIK